MLPESYNNHLTTYLKKSEYLMLLIVVGLIQMYRKIRLEELANKLPIPILFESRRKKLKRFLEFSWLTIEGLWLPIFSQWLKEEFAPNEVVYITIDRTRWSGINLIMVSLIIDKRGIPIYFELLDHVGSSDLERQTSILSRVLPLLKGYTKVVLGDREFCSVELARWLNEQEKTYFCLRLKRTTYIEVEKEIWTSLNNLGLRPGISLYYQGVKVTKTKGFTGGNIVGKWKKKYRGLTADEGWFILTNFKNLDETLLAYQKRFSIEEMFRDFKSGGYDLERTKLTEQRLISLILLITLAYAQATLSGKIIKNKGLAKYVGRVKEKGRIQRRHSNFYLGLQGKDWVDSLQLFSIESQELMQLSRHKCANYQRGMRAAKLIESSF